MKTIEEIREAIEDILDQRESDTCYKKCSHIVCRQNREVILELNKLLELLK